MKNYLGLWFTPVSLSPLEKQAVAVVNEIYWSQCSAVNSQRRWCPASTPRKPWSSLAQETGKTQCAMDEDACLEPGQRQVLEGLPWIIESQNGLDCKGP